MFPFEETHGKMYFKNRSVDLETFLEVPFKKFRKAIRIVFSWEKREWTERVLEMPSAITVASN
jgi:hypothetical protein